jgi:transcriptional regulator with XRE-family HTH domain
MNGRVPRPNLRRARLRLGWSKERAADEISRRFPHLGIDPRQIGRWESGETGLPRPMNVLALSTTYGLPPEELDLPPIPGAGPLPHDARGRSLGEHVPAPAPPVPCRDDLVADATTTAPARRADLAAPRPPASADEDDDVERRTLLKLIGGALTVPLTGRLEELRRNLDSALNPVATRHEVEEWERLVDDHSRMVGYLPPDLLLPDLLTDLDEARARLQTSPDELRARMVRVCTRLSALTAEALPLIGDTGNAPRYWRTALRTVDQVDDRSLRALVRGRRAVFALYERRPVESALALAGDAISVADGLPCAGAASGHAARAQALAQLGQHRQAHLALRDLSEMFARLPDTVRADRRSTWGWSEQRLRFVESHVHSHAGCLHDATTAHDAALALYPPAAVLGPAQVELHRATCLIVSGDPSEGARHAIRTIEAIPVEHRDDAVVHRTAALALDLVPAGARHLPAVVEARERLAPASGRS